MPVVLVHGWPVTATHWRHIVPWLERAGFLPSPVALPGLGTPAPAGQSMRKRDLALWLHAELRARGLRRYALVGHDWGGTVAALLAARYPDAVTSLVVEEEILPGIHAPLPAPGAARYPRWHGRFNREPGRAERFVPGHEDAYYGRFLRESAGPAGLENAAIADYLAAYAQPGVLASALAYYREPDDDADIAALTARPIATAVLAIGGRFAMGAAVGAGMREVADDVTGLVLDRSGHYPLEQEPSRSAEAIAAFLRTRR